MLIYTLPDGRQLKQGQRFELYGQSYPPRWLENATPDDLAARGITVENVPDPQPDPPPPPTIPDLLAYLGEKRWRVETSGCKYNGMTIATDRDSQVKITAAWTKAKADPNFQITNWKLAPGYFVPLLTNETIIAIGDAVTAHVQACFDKEAELTAGILSNPPTITKYDQIDLANWPSNS